jgi:glycosyltransferase involved in cell wall biosynthesis
VLRGASCGELSGGFIWDSPHLKGKTVAKWFFRALIRTRNRLLLRADGFLGISEAIREEYLECGVPAAKIRVINNGTDTDRFRPVDGAGERAALRVKLGIPDKTVLAYSGKLNKGKGLEFLLDAWQTLAARHANVHLLLIGAGGGGFLSCEDALRARVQSQGLVDRVTFTGFVENVNEYLQCADIFVFPSENESLSNALIEALACGLPCLASHVGGIPDTVKDGVNGRLLPVGDKDAWLTAIDELLGDPGLARQLGWQGRQRVLAHNSMESVTAAHVEYFNSLLVP